MTTWIYRSAVVFVFFALFFVRTTAVFAQNTEPLDSGVNAGKGYSVDGVLTIQGIEGIIANVLAVAISGIGFIGFVMMIIGSFQYLLSGGDSTGVQGGKNTITYAIIGLVVALSSWIILNFIATFTGVETIKILNICYGGIC